MIFLLKKLQLECPKCVNLVYVQEKRCWFLLIYLRPLQFSNDKFVKAKKARPKPRQRCNSTLETKPARWSNCNFKIVSERFLLTLVHFNADRTVQITIPFVFQEKRVFMLKTSFQLLAPLYKLHKVRTRSTSPPACF